MSNNSENVEPLVPMTIDDYMQIVEADRIKSAAAIHSFGSLENFKEWLNSAADKFGPERVLSEMV